METTTKKQTKAELKELDRQKAIEYVKTLVKPGDTVNVVLKSVSRSGMYRHIAVIVNNQNISGYVSTILGEKWHDDGSVGVSGCGMDMGFHLVYNLGYCLWPAGTPKPHGTRNGEPDSDGGYALKHNWL